jgi:anthranilate/para-aminobenzoate synthase component I
MTRIDKSSQVQSTTRSDSVRSVKERNRVVTSQKPKQDRPSLERLKSEILQKINGKSQNKAKEIAIKEIITWQFGDVATTDARYQSAFEKLKKQIEHSDKYQALLTQLIQKDA